MPAGVHRGGGEQFDQNAEQALVRLTESRDRRQQTLVRTPAAWCVQRKADI